MYLLSSYLCSSFNLVVKIKSINYIYFLKQNESIIIIYVLGSMLQSYPYEFALNVRVVNYNYTMHTFVFVFFLFHFAALQNNEMTQQKKIQPLITSVWDWVILGFEVELIMYIEQTLLSTRLLAKATPSYGNKVVCILFLFPFF